MCTAVGRGVHYDVDDAGVWVDCVRQRRTVVHNDYASLPDKRGMPEGHVKLTRHLGVPILDEGRVVLVVGVANKPTDYDDGDVRQLSLLMNGLWQHLRRRRELAQMREHEQAELLARMSSGVAHDLNNLFSAIHGCLELISRHLGEPEKERKPLGVAQESCEAAITLLRQMLIVGRHAEHDPSEQRLNDLVCQAATLGKTLVGKCELELDLKAMDDRVVADAGQCELALLNLLANARDAMPSGGRIVVATDEEEIPDTGVERLRNLKPGRYVAVAVHDHGQGIPEAARSRLFQPFFTTKPPGKGTGLGLCAVREVMQRHGGLVTVSSEPGRGATFKLLFPRARAA
jgi:signal transduction histidine kinase